MRRIRGKDMKPELEVRSLVHRLGYRFRLHDKKLPGKPDLVFRSRRKVILVHGCFWHGHDCPRGSQIPQTNTDFWTKKIDRNRTRDETVRRQLKAEGWKVLALWQCQLADERKLAQRLTRFLK